MNRNLVIILACGVCLACSPARRLERILLRNPDLVSLDTLFIRDSVVVPAVRLDTLVNISTVRDTILIQKDRLEVRVEVTKDTVRIAAECKEDTIYIDRLIPVEKVKLVRPDKLDHLISKIPWLVMGVISVLILLIFIRR